MWKRHKNYPYLEKKINKTEIPLIIDLLKKIPFIDIDIWGEILLKKKKEVELEEVLKKTETKFLSNLYNVKIGTIYLSDVRLMHPDDNPLRHDISLESKFLFGEEIIKIGFQDLYCMLKKIKTLSGFRYRIIEIEKINRSYFMRIRDVPTHDMNENNKIKAERYRSKLISFLKENNIYK
jgi:hypothetical protein